MVLDTHKWTSMPSMAARSRGRASSSADPAAAAASDAAAPSSASNAAHGGDPSTPPYALMDHVPLAIFVNGLLSAFNELRHCAPLSLATALASILQVRSEANLFDGTRLSCCPHGFATFCTRMGVLSELSCLQACAACLCQYLVMCSSCL